MVTPARLTAGLIMSDGRAVHVPAVPPAEPGAAGKIKVTIPYPVDAPAGLVARVVVTNEDLAVTFRAGIPLVNVEPGDTLTVEFGEESLDAEGFAWVTGG